MKPAMPHMSDESFIPVDGRRFQPLRRCCLIGAALVLITGCSSGGGSGDDVAPPEGDDPDTAQNTFNIGYVSTAGVTACSATDINAWLDFDMRDYYIYYDQVPQLNLSDYTDPEALVEDLRVSPDIYSYLADQQEQEARREEGIVSGYGFNFGTDSQGVRRFRYIRAGSPMYEAGIRRGDALLAIDSVLLDDMSDEQYDRLLFSEGAAPVFLVQTQGDSPRALTVQAADYRWITSPLTTVFTTVDGQRIGYLPVEAFYLTTEQELDSGLQELLEADIDDLILDMRYNRGGSVRVSERLASQIAGPALAGRIFQERKRNDKYESQSTVSEITIEPYALSLPRLVVLTTDDTASAPETIINGLQAHIDVTVIGAATDGKPFTSRAINYCGKSLNAMHSIRTNANGVSVLGGIQPDCAIQDDWAYPRNDARDALTAAGISYLQNSTCATTLVASRIDGLALEGRATSQNVQVGRDWFERPMQHAVEY